MSEFKTVGFIGLGVMGEPICRNLVKKSGKRVVVFGMGAFAVENVRTALESGAAHVTVVARRLGTVCRRAGDAPISDRSLSVSSSPLSFDSLVSSSPGSFSLLFCLLFSSLFSSFSFISFLIFLFLFLVFAPSSPHTFSLSPSTFANPTGNAAPDGRQPSTRKACRRTTTCDRRLGDEDGIARWKKGRSGA